MIYSLNGKLIAKEPGLAVIECAGVGYACRTTDNTLAKLGTTDANAFVYTYMHITQDDVALFGFADKTELGCFRMLLDVTGVGPKAALSILSDMDANTFALKVATGDHKALTKVKGIGPKMAQRIVLELKDKLAKGTGSVPSPAGGAFVTEVKGARGDAMEALMVLGYSREEAQQAIAPLDPALSVEELIKQALKSLASF
ncbi:MAG: Holliday junction branch migration protein RuvA [Oscillospiraceae bacterium]|nr:Holliday junction branch migration protein RuvA [Oscillospiraceae bacterium]